MGPPFSTDSSDLESCEDNSTVGSPWVGGGGQIIVNPPPDLPVATAPLYTGNGLGGGCWTASQAPQSTCN